MTTNTRAPLTAMDFSKIPLMDALDLAILIEEEAEERYSEFSKMMGSRYKEDAGDFFAWMSKNEAKHGQELLRRRETLFGKMDIVPMAVDRTMIEDVEAPDYSQPRGFMSPLAALKVALNSEVKAWTFFDKALGYITDPQVRLLFEELKKEEVEHQKLLQEQIARVAKTEKPDVDPDDVDEPPGL